MVKTTVWRREDIYACFPDIARAADGTLVCINRECMMHAPFPFSRLVARRSRDEGMNWGERQILIDCVARAESVAANRSWLEPDALAGYEESRGRVREAWQTGASLNCPRLITLRNGTLLLFGDFTVPAPGGGSQVRMLVWRSLDHGATWESPELLNAPRAGHQPAPTELRDGRLLLGMDLPAQDGGASGIRNAVCFSADGGKSWSELTILPVTAEDHIVETSFVELDDGTLVGFGRNLVREMRQVPSQALKVISRDGGRTWTGPFQTWLVGCEGRPKAGLLRSGEVCITYRCDLPNELLAMHVMTQPAAASPELGHIVERMPVPEDVPGEQARARGEARPWYMTGYYPGRTIILDMDRSVHRDNGYSGWVQLDNGDIFVVDYIHDDAPLAQLRSYRVSRADIILFPEGDLPWLHPSWQPFRAITHSLSQRQQAANAARPPR
jgi:hypothetical protein